MSTTAFTNRHGAEEGGLQFIPTELFLHTAAFLAHPGDHFRLRTTSKLMSIALEPVYMFKDLEHVMRACGNGRPRNGAVKGIRLPSDPSAETIVKMLDIGVPSPIVLGLLRDCCENRIKSVLTSIPLSHFVSLLFASFDCGPEFNDLVIHSHSSDQLSRVRDQLVGAAIACAEDAVGENMLKMYAVGNSCADFHTRLLLRAIGRRLYSCTEWLVTQRVALLSRSYGGSYPIQLAVETGCPKMVSIVCRAGALVNCRYRSNHSPPLHVACLADGHEVLSTLLLHKPSLTARDFYGRTALQILRTSINELEKTKSMSWRGYGRLADLRTKLTLLKQYALQEATGF